MRVKLIAIPLGLNIKYQAITADYAYMATIPLIAKYFQGLHGQELVTSPIGRQAALMEGLHQ